MGLIKTIEKSAILCITVLTVISSVKAKDKDLRTYPTDTAAERLSQFVQNIGTFNRILPQEKVYLHFDNTSYYIGETIWFKAYVVRADSLLPLKENTLLHVQLVNQEGAILDSRKLKVVNGRCHGEFSLKNSYHAGFYEVRAYTEYMLNFGIIQQPYEEDISAFFFNEDYCRRFFQENGTLFSRVFPIYNAPKKEGNYNELQMQKRPYATDRNHADKKKREDISMSFYPEGGYLVQGLNSRVAFEIRGEEGQYLKVNGQIKDSRGKTVATISTSHRGKGEFFLHPLETGSYKAIFKYKRKTYSFLLPEAKPEGWVMAVESSAQKNVRIRLFKSGQAPDVPLGLSVICRGKPYLFEPVAFSPEGRYVLDIPAGLLPDGVCQATLFDTDGHVLAERLFFVMDQTADTPSLAVEGAGKNLRPYEKVTLVFSQAECSDLDFSISVCDRRNREKNYTTENILTNLLLSSDLYGFIEAPEYYFEDNSEDRHHEMDLLMLTQGWRRYEWPVMAGVRPFYLQYQREKNLRLSGRVWPLLGTASEQKRRQESRLGVDLFVRQDSTYYTGLEKADTSGRFSLNLPELEGEMDVFLNVIGDKSFTARNRPEFFDISRYGFVTGYDLAPHMFYEFIPIDQNYTPHFRKYSYYECHSPSILLTGPDGDTPDPSVSKSDDEAWLLSLSEVEIEGKRKVRRLDFSQPALVLDPLEEMNLQMDLGMFLYGPVRELVAANAAVRLGLRGAFFYSVNKVPYEIDHIPVIEDPLSGAGVDENSWRYSVLGIMSGGDPKRKEDMSRYMNRYRRGNGGANFTSPDYFMHNVVSNQRISPDMLPLEERAMEYTDSIRIYTDKNYRGTYSIEEIRKDYSASFILDFESGKKMRPLYVGRHFRFQGYSCPAEFYSPDYSKMDLKNPPKDYRRTLYWNPDVRTDSQGRARIEFYNNSTARHLVVSAEGLTPDGQPVVLKQ